MTEHALLVGPTLILSRVCNLALLVVTLLNIMTSYKRYNPAWKDTEPNTWPSSLEVFHTHLWVAAHTHTRLTETPPPNLLCYITLPLHDERIWVQFVFLPPNTRSSRSVGGFIVFSGAGCPSMQFRRQSQWMCHCFTEDNVRRPCFRSTKIAECKCIPLYKNQRAALRGSVQIVSLDSCRWRDFHTAVVGGPLGLARKVGSTPTPFKTDIHVIMHTHSICLG